MDLLIETVNSGDFGWKADICMLQKHHHMYDADKCDKNKKDSIELAQTSQKESEENEFMGTDSVTDGKKNTKDEKKFGEGDEFAKAWGHFQQYQNQYPSASAIPEGELPE